MRNRRSIGLLLLMLLFGALAGGIIGEFLSQYNYFKWMGFGGVNGYRELFAFAFGPMDFRVIKFSFDFVLRINLGSIIGMILSVIIFFRKL